MQLGDENKHLTGDLEFLLFKNVYRRHTNFADETFEQKFNGIPEIGKSISCRVKPPRDDSVQGQAPARRVSCSAGSSPRATIQCRTAPPRDVLINEFIFFISCVLRIR